MRCTCVCVCVDIEAHKEYNLHIANHVHSLDDGCSHSEGISYLMQMTFFRRPDNSRPGL